MHVADCNRLFARYIVFMVGVGDVADLWNHTDAWDGLLGIGTHRMCFCRPCGGIDRCLLMGVGAGCGLLNEWVGSDLI